MYSSPRKNGFLWGSWLSCIALLGSSHRGATAQKLLNEMRQGDSVSWGWVSNWVKLGAAPLSPAFLSWNLEQKMDHASTKAAMAKEYWGLHWSWLLLLKGVGQWEIKGWVRKLKMSAVTLFASENRPWERVFPEGVIMTHWLIELVVFCVQLCEFIVRW